ncbi:MAG: hypothetical protein HMLIMOIP_000503 [Candidatus Nitrosomirales archaeon]|jgi:hypothetical protein
MQKKMIIAASAIAVVAIAIALIPLVTTRSTSPTIPTYGEYEVRKITIDNVMLNVEIADDSEKIQRGLMYREMLPENQGMLFIFDEERKYQFWMMNMKIHLDMIWLDSNGKVVYIVEDVAPCTDSAHTSQCTYNPDEPARYVLEVNSGFVKKYGINENSVMHILT